MLAGDVVSFGAGDRGQLGLGGKDDEWTPRVIEPLTGEGPRAAPLLLCILYHQYLFEDVLGVSMDRVGCLRPAFRPVGPLWICLNGTQCVCGLQE